MITDFKMLTIPFDRISHDSIHIDAELFNLLNTMKKEDRFKVLAYQQKHTANIIYLIPLEAFKIKSDLLSNYDLVSVFVDANSIDDANSDGLYDPIAFAN